MASLPVDRRVENDDFVDGLHSLLAQYRWRARSEAAHEYVAGRYGVEQSMSQHLEVYQRFIQAGRQA